MSTTQRRSHITDVRTVAVPVTDQARSLTFFVDQLGFEKRMDAPFGMGQRWIEVAAPGSSVSIALYPARPSQATGVDTGIRFTSDDVEADHADLLARNVDIDAEVTMEPVPMFAFLDPDRNRFVIVSNGRR